MFLELPISFKGQTITIVGGGVSLKGFDFSRVKPPVMAVNDSVFYVDAKYLVAIDASWHKKHGEFLDNYDGYLITYIKTERKDAFMIKLDIRNSWHDYTLKSASLSGFTALAVAFHMGAEKVILLGYDGGFEVGQSSNFYPNRCANIATKTYERKNMHYEYFSRYPIINVGMESKIPWFYKVPLDCDFYNVKL